MTIGSNRPSGRARSVRALRAVLAGALLPGLLVTAMPVSAAVVPTTDGTSISAAGVNADDARIAFDKSGNGFMVYDQMDGDGNFRIMLRIRNATGSFTTAQTLSAAGQDARQARVALDGNGNAFVMWQRSDGTHYRTQIVRRSTSGSLSAVQTLSSSGWDAGDGQLAVDKGGNAYAVWSRFDGTFGRIQLRRRAADGTLGSVKTLSGDGDGEYPQIAVDSAGSVSIVWQQNGSPRRIQYVSLSAAGTLAAVKTLSSLSRPADNPMLSVETNRRVLVTWEQSDGTNARVYLRVREPDTGWSLPGPISAPGQDAASGVVASSLGSTGGSIIAWERSDGANRRVQALRRSPAGAMSAIVTLSDPGFDGRGPVASIDSAGNALIAWSRFDGTFARTQVGRRSAGGTVDPAATLSAAGQDAYPSAAAVDLKGNALVVWDRNDGSNARVQAAYVAQLQQLSPSPMFLGYSPAIAVDTAGNALFAWANSPYMSVRRRSAAGVLDPVKNLNDGSIASQSQQVAFDGAGNAFIVWLEYDTSNKLRVKFVRRSASGSYSAATVLSASGQSASLPRLGIDPQGRVTVIWSRFDGTAYRVQLRRRETSGTWSAVQTLSGGTHGALDANIAVDKNGNAYVAWHQSDGVALRVYLVRRSAAGTVSAPKAVSPSGHEATEPAIGVATNGDAVISWSQLDTTEHHVKAIRRSAAGTYGPVASLSTSGDVLDAPRMAVDRAGNAIVVWTRSDGKTPRIELARLSAGGSVSGQAFISAEGQAAGDPAIAVDASGRSVIAWERSDGSVLRVQALRRTAGGSLGPVQTLSPGDLTVADGTFSGVTVALNSSGSAAYIAWFREVTPTLFTVQAVRF